MHNIHSILNEVQSLAVLTSPWSQFHHLGEIKKPSRFHSISLSSSLDTIQHGALTDLLHVCAHVTLTCEHSGCFSIHNAQSVFHSGHGERHCSTDSSLERALERACARYMHYTHSNSHIHTHSNDNWLDIYNAPLCLISDSSNQIGSLLFLSFILDRSSSSRHRSLGKPELLLKWECWAREQCLYELPCVITGCNTTLC